MRKIIKANSTFYYPEYSVDLIDTDEVKIIVENPTGYVEGDLVRMFYTFGEGNIQVGVDTFEMFSPLVKDGVILRAIFYLPLSAEFANDSISFTPLSRLTQYFIKTKGSTDFTNYANVLDTNTSFFFLTTSGEGVRSNPIPVFFFSERGAGLFENRILNRQSWVADTNFSSVAIRQDKFNPFDMEAGGRNLALETNQGTKNWIWAMQTGDYTATEHIEDGVSGCKLTRGSTPQSGWSYGGYTKIGRDKLEGGETYMITFDVFTNKASTLLLYFRSSNNLYELISSWDYKNNTCSANTWSRIVLKATLLQNLPPETNQWLYITGLNTATDAYYIFRNLKIEKGSNATAWTPNPEDYEVTEVVSGADLAGGLDKFNSSYAFKLLDDSEWVTKKLICPENYIQLFWGEPRAETRFSFWFKIKEIEKSSEAWGEVEHYRELRAGTDVKERRKEVTKYRFPKTKLRLTSGVFRQDIIDKLKGIAHSTTIYKYNPYTKLNEGRGVIAQVTEMWRAVDGSPTPQEGVGHFRLNDIYTFSNTIEELINSPESVFDLEFSFKGNLRAVHFIQNRDDEENSVLISGSITESNFTKKTFNGSITIDRSRKVKPILRFRISAATPAEIKDIYIKGSLGGIEDVEVEIATMNIIPRQDGESEMELTVISDDFRKPDYLYF